MRLAGRGGLRTAVTITRERVTRRTRGECECECVVHGARFYMCADPTTKTELGDAERMLSSLVLIDSRGRTMRPLAVSLRNASALVDRRSSVSRTRSLRAHRRIDRLKQTALTFTLDEASDSELQTRSTCRCSTSAFTQTQSASVCTTMRLVPSWRRRTQPTHRFASSVALETTA